MIRKTACLNVLDNSSISHYKCLKVDRKTIGSIGDLLFGVVARELYNKRVFRKRMFFAILLTTRRAVFRPDGAYYVRFLKSGVLLLKEDKEALVGTRFNCVIPLEIRRSAFREICQYTRKTY